MPVNSINPPFPQFNDANGAPLEGGYIYIGTPGFEARSTPKASYFDQAFTIPSGTATGAGIRTRAGYPTNNGAASVIYADGDFSITVTDQNGVLIFSALNNPFAFNQVNSGSGLYPDGNTSLVAVGFTAEQNSGVIRLSAGTVADVVQGAIVSQRTSALITDGVPHAFPDGTVAAPSITNTGDTNTGIYFPVDGQTAISSDGVNKATFSANSLSVSVPVRLPATGSETATQLNFGTAGTGIYGGANSVVFSISGTDRVFVQNGNVSFIDDVIVTHTGTQAAPSIWDGIGNGLFFPGSAACAITGGGTEAARFAAADTRIYQSSTGSPGQANSTTGIAWNSNGQMFVSADNTVGRAMNVNRNQNDVAITFQRSGSIVGTIAVTASATAYNTSSDYRLKDVIDAPFYDPAEKIKALADAQKWFTWKTDGETDIGWLAHELQEIEPRAVTGEKDAIRNGEPEYQGRDDSKLVVHLVAALADAIRRIEYLEAQL